MIKKRHIEHSTKNFAKSSKQEEKVRVTTDPRSSKLVILLSGILAFLPTFVNAGTTEVSTKSQELQRLTKSVQEKERLHDEIEQGFDHYIQAYNNVLLSLCTQKFADYRGVELSNDFYAKMDQDNKYLKDSKESLYKTLKLGEHLIGKDFSQTINEFFEEDKKNSLPKKDELTRGYCLNFQKSFGEKIMENLNQYQKQAPKIENTLRKENTLYLNTKYQLQNTGLKLDQKITPTAIMLEGKEYPVQCRYLDVQQYDQALAMNSPIKDVTYKASDYFYNTLSPQIDYLITCTSEKSLPKKNKIAVGDTYPWYQPVVVGSNGIPAAGDSLVYVKNKQVTLVLGHEPCVCNGNDEAHCNKIKNISRQYKAEAWKLIDALEEEKPKHNLQAQETITSFTTYLKNEIKKDFCFIDTNGIINKLAESVEKIKEVEPNGVNSNQK